MQSKLFTPIQIGRVEIKNRIALPSMCVYFCNKDGHMSDTFYDYVEERARGGIGLAIIPGVPHGKLSSGRPALVDDSYLPDWEKLVSIVHKYGAKLFCQLHPAKFQAGRGLEVEYPADYTHEEIRRLVESYAACAKRCLKAGVDGVEIHGGHAHEVAMFMSPYYNSRTDEYGGSVEGRAKFPEEIIKAIKRECGNDYPVVMRISGNEYVEGGREIVDSAEICKILEKAGADAIHVSSGMPASDGYVNPPLDVDDCFNVDAAAYMKSQVSVPVIAVNRIVDINEAEEVVNSGKADMVAMARALLCDPELINKYLGKNIEPVRRCLGCNQGCRDAKVYKKIVCTQNPFLGFSRDRVLQPISKQKKILIAGSGPAGLELAVDLVKRGYTPQIYEKGNIPGGLINLAAIPPKKSNFKSIIDYRMGFLRMNDIKIHFNVTVDEALIAKENPDVVIVATGTTPIKPPIPGIDSKNVYIADDVLAGKITLGNHVLVLGAGLVGCEVADFLGEMGKKIELVDIISDIAPDLNYSRRHFMLERMNQRDINYLLGNAVKSINLPSVTIENREGQTTTLADIDDVVICAGRKSENSLMKLAEKFPATRFICIGDANKVGVALDAIHAAAVLACDL